MSGEGYVGPVEQEYLREEHREQKVMDSKQSGAKFSSNILRLGSIHTSHHTNSSNTQWAFKQL